MEKAKFRVDEISCQTCANRIQERLNREKGIDFVNINLITEEIQVEYAKDQISQDRIKQVIEELGFRIQ